MTREPFTPSRDFKGIWIPKEIWLDRTLTFFEKSLFAEIHSLDGKRGCFADNPYFCNFFNVAERTLQRGLKKLKEYSYISEESFNGRNRILRSNMKNVYDKFDTSAPSPQNDNDKFDTPDPSNMSPSPSSKPIEPENIKENINPPNPPKGGKSPPKIGRAPLVETTDKEHEKLAKDFTEPLRDEAYRHLSEWKKDQPKSKQTGDDNKKIRKWVIAAVLEQGKRDAVVERHLKKKKNSSHSQEEIEKLEKENEERRKKWRETNRSKDS